MTTEATTFMDPDSVLPDQYFDSIRLPAGVASERKLMLAILQDAVDCYHRYMLARDPRGQQEFSEARDWIESPEEKWVFSFENICGMLSLDPLYIRDGLARIAKARVGNRVIRERLTPRIVPVSERTTPASVTHDKLQIAS